MRPFCTDPDAAARFDAWAQRLASSGVELNEADAFVVGLLASRESNLEAARRALVAVKPKLRAKLEQTEDRAARAFAVALDRAERIFAPRMEEAVEVRPMAAAVGGGGRVLRMVASSAAPPRDAVSSRILGALRGGVRLTKPELRRFVAGGQSEFLRAVKALVQTGRVERAGSGRKRRPWVYFLGR